MFNASLIADLTPNLRDESLVKGSSDYSDMDIYFERNLFKKVSPENYEYPATIVDETYKKFHDANMVCKMVNENFHLYLSNPVVASLLFQWRRCVYAFLGGINPSLSTIELTNGATSSTKKGALPTDRVERAEVSSRLNNSPLFRFSPWKRILTESSFRFGPLVDGVQVCIPSLRVVKQSYTTCDVTVGRLVPKTFSTARVVWPEPAINASHQRSLGLQMARAINRTHLSTDSAKEKHQSLACRGSSTDPDIVTSDWTSASDLIPWELSKFLAPPRWAVAMDLFRSHSVEYPVKGLVGQFPCYMTATMGNGFCWEWETIVFFTFLQALSIENNLDIPIGDLHAFGDDTIYPSRLHPFVVKFSKIFGFDMNLNKSFSSGPFRESCGGDYLNGKSIRPIFCKSVLNTTVEKYRLYNEIVKAYGEKPESSYFQKVLSCILEDIPEKERLFGPLEYGDQVLYSTDSSRYRLKDGHGLISQRILVMKPSWNDFHSIGDRPASYDTMRRALNLGWLQGHGYVERQVPQRIKGKLVFHNGKQVYVKQLAYARFVKHNSTVQFSPTWVAFYAYPNGVNENRPLSVFEDALPYTKAPRRLFCRDGQNVALREKVVLYKELLIIQERIKAVEERSRGVQRHQFLELLAGI